MKFLKVGRVAIITRGRYAGKKVRFPIDVSGFLEFSVSPLVARIRIRETRSACE